MGVPALFRWLSKKYPKIIYPVVEEEEVKVPDAAGDLIQLPIDISKPNPNGMEYDNLYLDMNGIVHPCTHPEGKPAPETEQEMMIEVFKYTERVVNMIRPRKLLFMAIDGVAPRAKMNQQRSRRFRSAQEAKDKEEARKEAVAMWEAMGKTLSEDEKNKKSWDSNAITPGTPFMDLLANSLRYWVVQKLNSDPGWKDMEVIISDASVPGEGEHKIMDFIRRQRSNPGHDANAKHVIYGLDADLIMLALATHEPHFKVLREDVFHDANKNACRICGQEGHYAAQCTGTKPDAPKDAAPPEAKPFIFLDVSVLREYLEAELNISQAHSPAFPFDLEQAIDDWVLLIFFVGNDFLPHMPSLEIREGAIDTLLKIWKDELGRMGGYITQHGTVVLSRVQVILQGLASREDDIFRRRKEAEDRQNQNAKRRKIDVPTNHAGAETTQPTGPSPSLNLTAPPTAPSFPSNSSSSPGGLASLPPRPDFGFKADQMGFGGPVTSQSMHVAPLAAQALAGSNHDVVKNRAAIRMANMSAAEVLKAELAGLTPLKPSSAGSKSNSGATGSAAAAPGAGASAIQATLSPSSSSPPPPILTPTPTPAQFAVPIETSQVSQPTPTSTSYPSGASISEIITDAAPSAPSSSVNGSESHPNGNEPPTSENDAMDTDAAEAFLHGVKRKIDDVVAEEAAETEDVVAIGSDEDEAPEDIPVVKAMKVNPDGTVDQEDTVKLYEPGYKERYYRQKFGVEYSDNEFKKKIAASYIEGICWVLHYYYQGTPSWQWYYPYHFAPFAADFEALDQFQVNFDMGQPFKPFEQLMGVFPAASRMHIPQAFQHLMVDEESPILDFYPSSFEVDMNGKRMLWQGVALLPFIEPKRLLEAMAPHYSKLTEDEVRRNTWGHNALYVSEDHPLYAFLEKLYGKRKNQEPAPLPVKQSKAMNGSVLPNPDCLPGATFYSPLSDVDLPDIPNDRSLSAIYLFPKQLTPHRSVLLPGVRRPPRILSSMDLENARRGGNNRGRGRGGGDFGRSGNFDQRGGGRGGPPSYRDSQSHHNSHSYNDDRGGGYSRPPNPPYQQQPNSYRQPPPYSSHQQPSYPSYQSRPPPPVAQQYGAYGYGTTAPPPQQNFGGMDPYSAPSRGGGSYNSSYGRGGGGGGGGYGNHTSRGGYGGYGGNDSGYGGYGGNTSYQNNSHGGSGGRGGGGYGQGYQGGGRGGGSYNAPRGRGRGGY